MHGRVVGAAIALVVLLAVPAVASAATKTVQAGPPASQAAKFANASGANNPFPDADGNDFFRKTTTIHKGDSVKWKINGFHNVLFPQGGVEAPGLIMPVPGSQRQRRGRRGRAAVLVQRQSQPRVQPARRGAERRQDVQGQPESSTPVCPADDGPPAPYKLKFKKTGSFSYVCSVHAGMGGTVKVVKKGKSIPSARADKRAAAKAIQKQLNQVRVLVTGTNLSLNNSTIQAGNDLRSGATIYKFFPANLTVKTGTTVTLQMPPSTTEVHTFTFGPINGKDAYVDQLANEPDRGDDRPARVLRERSAAGGPAR